jgi:type I restriction-modification system DNA methylase subunit
MTTDTIISKVWSFCHTLRDDGVGYGDYLEQLTFLLFLKMVAEIIDNIEAGLNSFRIVAASIRSKSNR